MPIISDKTLTTGFLLEEGGNFELTLPPPHLELWKLIEIHRAVHMYSMYSLINHPCNGGEARGSCMKSIFQCQAHLSQQVSLQL